MNIKALYTLAAALTATLVATTLHAQVSYPYSSYGHVTNSSVNGYCGATAIANSFQWLANTYPQYYSNLIDGSALQTRNDIVGFEQLDTNGDPVSNATIWNSKIEYINEYAPGSTVFWAQMQIGTSTNYLDSSAIQNTRPTLAGISNQLAMGEDVEFAFVGTTNLGMAAIDDTNAFAHMVTLTGIGPGGNSITYLDPNNPTNVFTAALTTDTNGYLSFTWNNNNNAPQAGVEIYEAWAESPIPEPTSLVLLGMSGLSGLLYLRRRATKSS